MSKIETATQFMVNIAYDNRHGYSQRNRWGNPDFDCSSLVISAWQYAGVPVKSNGATYTGNMYWVFRNCGFSDVTGLVNLATGYGLQRGDVLLNARYHTELYIGNGKVVGACIDENGGVNGWNPGDQRGNEIRVGYYYNYPWTSVLRYTAGNHTKPIKKTGYANKRLVKFEKGKATFNANTNIRDDASVNANITGSYKKGESVFYDSVYEGDGYNWLSYISYQGTRRFAAYKKVNGTPWVSFGGQAPQTKPQAKPKVVRNTNKKFIKYENWHATFLADTNIRADASTKSKIVGMYKSGQTVYYDQVYEADGYRWISWIGGSGNRRYAAIRKLDGGNAWVKF